MIVNKELVVSNRKKADIVAELRKLDFRPFSKVSKAKKAGETEELVEIDDEENEDEDDDEPCTSYCSSVSDLPEPTLSDPSRRVTYILWILIGAIVLVYAAGHYLLPRGGGFLGAYWA